MIVASHNVSGGTAPGGTAPGGTKRRLPRLAGPDREILRLAVPAFGALVAEPLFLLTDSAIVGRIGTVPLGGLGVASQALTALVNVSIFLAYGTTAAVSRQLGAGRPDRRGLRRLARGEQRRGDLPADQPARRAVHAAGPGRHRGAAGAAGHPHPAAGGGGRLHGEHRAERHLRPRPAPRAGRVRVGH